MQYDPSKLDAATLRKFEEARQSPEKFAEHFLIDPSLKTPFKSNYVQQKVFRCGSRDVWLCVHRRAGKAEWVENKIYTPEGPRRMGDIEVGDRVCTPDGGSATVTALHPQGTVPLFKITFKDKSSIITSKDHLWRVQYRAPREGFKWETLSTGEMFSRGVSVTRKHPKGDYTAYKYRVPQTDPVEFVPLSRPNIDPYLLGAFLGDGCIGDNYALNIASKGGEVVRYLEQLPPLQGDKWKDIDGGNRVALANCRNTSSSYANEFRNLHLWKVRRHQKFIPECYKYQSVEDRISLLQGLLDTDGSARKGGGYCHFVTTSERLREDVVWLVQSLGGTAVAYPSVRTGRKRKWDLHILLPEWIDPFRLKRKLRAYRSGKHRPPHREVVSIEYAFDGEAQCITIDHPKHLYLTEEFIVTHNCVDEDTTVLHPKLLRPVPIKEAVSFGETLVFDFDRNETVWSNAELISSGQKRCIRFKLECGTEFSLSEDHHLFCRRMGWVPAINLSVGDQVLSPGRLDIGTTHAASPEEIEDAIDRVGADQRIPDEVFGYQETSLNLFLSSFFTSFGRVMARDQIIAFMLWNSSMAKDMKHLFLRVGISSRIDEDGNLFIEGDIDQKMLLRLCGVDIQLTEVHSPRKWERIIGKKSVGLRTVYDMCVGHPNHAFIGSDIVMHNSYSLTLIALWHATMREGCKVVLFAPSTTQVDEFFSILDSWIDTNPILASMKAKEGNFKNPHQRITFKNGSYIAGFILGVNANLEASRRGLTADVVLVDEGQELKEGDWDVVGPIMRGDPTRRNRIRGYVAGTTPEDPSGDFFKRIYKTPHKRKRSEVIFIPITENPEWTPEMIEEEREEINNERRWRREYLLEITEKSSAVFKNEEILDATQEDWEYGTQNIISELPRFITVDWDKVQTGTSISVFQYSPSSKRATLLCRESVPQSEFHYLEACRKVIEYYQAYLPELVVCDAGNGEMQWEYLVFEAMKLGLPMAERTLKIPFQGKIEVLNPVTNEPEKKMLKPFLVAQLQRKLQDREILFPAHDEELKNQFFKFEVVRINKTGPEFTKKDEHFVDTFLFLMYGLWLTFENPLETGQHQGKTIVIDQKTMHEVVDTKLEERILNSELDDLSGRPELPGGGLIHRPGFDDASFGSNLGFGRGDF